MARLNVICGGCGSESIIDYKNGDIRPGAHISTNQACSKCEDNKSGRYTIKEVLSEGLDTSRDEIVKISDSLCTECKKNRKPNQIRQSKIKGGYFDETTCEKCRKPTKWVIIDKLYGVCVKCGFNNDGDKMLVFRPNIRKDGTFKNKCKSCNHDIFYVANYISLSICSQCYTKRSGLIIPLKHIKKDDKSIKNFVIESFPHLCNVCKKQTLYATALVLDGKCLNCSKVNRNIFSIADAIDTNTKEILSNDRYCDYCDKIANYRIFEKGDDPNEKIKKKNELKLRKVLCNECDEITPIKHPFVNDLPLLYNAQEEEWFPCPHCKKKGKKKTKAIIVE